MKLNTRHALVRYTLPNGEQVIMNIVGRESDQMVWRLNSFASIYLIFEVNFVSPDEYLFGTQKFEDGAVQGVCR
jgi:hypothetical protein